ncbi:hypothetical protein O0I10_006432 [Lichtheimia ornata]|uniref:COP9 signalosome complex subunit 3 n=1 Tax=Lichtheimia ornata TaxID=688661 RepID=A0AAD7XUV4_9FUNG|nr:uncharacterized protein O0I10_006432 [Lichtheimia ornata]KAJ8657904.1 hypothetical protein O0I10_006432 [Lichtheimia ornata]
MADSTQEQRTAGSGNPQEQAMTDEVLATIMSTDHQQPTALQTLASQLVTLKETQLRAYTSANVDPLTSLDPSVHTLGYLFFVTARCLGVDRADQAQFYVNTMDHFVNVCDPQQLAYAPARTSLIAKSLEHLAKISNNHMIALEPLSIAISKLSPNHDSLTCLHATFAKECLLAKMYRYPLPILDTDIVNVDPQSHDISIKSFLLYHYYGAMIYIGNKNFERAIEFLVLTISAPSHAVSAIQIEAYKKFILTSLIHYGYIPPLPKYTYHMIEKTFKAKHQPYMSIVDAFESKGVERFKSVIETNREVLNADANMGLAKQCLQALSRETIKRLTNVYVTLSLREMATMLEPIEGDRPYTEHDVERLLVEMIEKEQIHAKLSITQGEHGEQIKMVNFEEEQVQDTAETTNDLEKRIFDAAAVGKQISIMDKAEGLTKDFQTKYMNISMHGGEPFGGPVGFDEEMEVPLDED